MNNTKSATTAGLLGILLGGVGAHDWYLGNRNKALMHVILMGGAFLVMFIVSIFLPAILPHGAYLDIKGVLSGVNTLAWGAIGVNIIWGVIEGMLIIERGDEGLAGQHFVMENPDQLKQPDEISDTPVVLDLNEMRSQNPNNEVIFYNEPKGPNL